MRRSFADKFTAMMATWTFVFTFLLVCLAEILWNHSSYAMVHHWNFDPTTIILNLILSLWAAVQGSIIMISQKAQAKRDKTRDDKMEEMSQHTLLLTEKAVQHDEREEEITKRQTEAIRIQSEAIHRLIAISETNQDIFRAIQEELERSKEVTH